MKKSEIKFIFVAFLIWRAALCLVLFFAARDVPLQTNFLGGGATNYVTNPMFWALGNFDGQHYVNIAQNGYGVGEYTFFPLYPLIIKLLGNVFGSSLFSLNLIGQIISNIFFIISLIGFYKLIRLDLSEKVAKFSIVLLLLFPMSFYFAAVYTESLFFALLVWSFYLARRKKFLWASVIGAFLSFCRPIGIFILPALAVEWYMQNYKAKGILRKFPLSITLSSGGLIAYMFYLNEKLSDPFAFFHEQTLVGEHRSSHIILIPQIIYRYIFKILPSLNYSYFPSVFFTILEFSIGIIYLAAVLALFLVTRLSYAVFAFLAYITPTFLGSFSSQPRYVLIIFPVYFILAKYLIEKKTWAFAFCLVSSILLVISFSLFSRGYWIS